MIYVRDACTFLVFCSSVCVVFVFVLGLCSINPGSTRCLHMFSQTRLHHGGGELCKSVPLHTRMRDHLLGPCEWSQSRRMPTSIPPLRSQPNQSRSCCHFPAKDSRSISQTPVSAIQIHLARPRRFGLHHPSAMGQTAASEHTQLVKVGMFLQRLIRATPRRRCGRMIRCPASPHCQRSRLVAKRRTMPREAQMPNTQTTTCLSCPQQRQRSKQWCRNHPRHPSQSMSRRNEQRGTLVLMSSQLGLHQVPTL